MEEAGTPVGFGAISRRFSMVGEQEATPRVCKTDWGEGMQTMIVEVREGN